MVIAISFLPSLKVKMFSPNSFSTTGGISGMEFNATAFVGCDNEHVRACKLYDCWKCYLENYCNQTDKCILLI